MNPVIATTASTPSHTPRLRQRLQRGFRLVELMVVLVIIGVLAALIVPNVLDRADDARVTAAKTDVNNLMQALKLYRLDNQRYPSGEQGLTALVAKPAAAPVPPNWRPYLEKLPADPWSRPYQYLNPGLHGEVDVLSLGADGQPGRRRQGRRRGQAGSECSPLPAARLPPRGRCPLTGGAGSSAPAGLIHVAPSAGLVIVNGDESLAC